MLHDTSGNGAHGAPALQQATGRISRREDLTFKANLRSSRHGWLRLTPAYSVRLVSDLLDRYASPDSVVLDPFAGTGTTAIGCAERGIRCETVDINPFLTWLAGVKTSAYSPNDLKTFWKMSKRIGTAIQRTNGALPWIPPIHQIEKWWSPAVLRALRRAMAMIRRIEPTVPTRVTNLLLVAFCQTLIDHANVTFGHVSMSFKKAERRSRVSAATVAATWERNVVSIAAAAASEIRCDPKPILCDARDLRTRLAGNQYDCVITSPPYCNRMSYVRELRPYMYWLGFIDKPRQAGELDWQAIGGTWGIATTNVGKWAPPADVTIPFDGFDEMTAKIRARSPTLGRYVQKYFFDVMRHCASLFDVVAPGGNVHYIVGNSKFYDVVVPTELVYAAIFEEVGFKNVGVEAIRKRNSKKELFEFVVSATKA